MKLRPLLLCLLLAACAESTPATTAVAQDPKPVALSSATVPGEDQHAIKSSPALALAAAPEINLVDNRYLWHLYRGGLLLPLASEGARKYNHEYARPWTSNVEKDGLVGRVLASKQSSLRFAWFDEAPASATMRVRVHGLVAGQRVSVRLNDKTLANVNLEAAWQTLELPLPAGYLQSGENTLKLHVAKAGSAKGKRSYGLWRAIQIAPDGAASESFWQRLQPAVEHQADGTSLDALSGFPRMIHLLEVPHSAWLDFKTAGEGAFSIFVTGEQGVRTEIFSHQSSATGWQEHQISLASFAGQLVRLELLAPAKGAWGRPRIALEKAAVAERPKAASNLILLVVDALRSDHVPLYSSVYGEESAVRMPNTEREASKGALVFLHNQAASPSSPPSHGSIQTGMIPRVHGVDGDRGKLKSGTPMISTQARAAGLAAGYFGNNPFGMARLQAPGQWTEFHQPGMEGKSNDCTTLVEMMLKFSEEQNKAGKRFFISSLPYETHTPYRYHKGISEHYYDGPWSKPLGQSVNGDVLGALGAGKMTLSKAQWKQLKGLYRGEAEYWDQCFGQLISGLSEAKLLADTAIVLTSDHGEGMFEHGRMGHAFGHYRELGDVPFVVFWPALSSTIRGIETITSHRDIAPTLLDILGIVPDPKIQGQSVLPLALRDGPWIDRVVSLEYGRSYSLRSKRYKLIADYNGLQEIYDLKTDPWEKRDIKDKPSDAVRYLRDMAGFFLEYRADWHYLDWGTLNQHKKGLLRAAQEREAIL